MTITRDVKGIRYDGSTVNKTITVRMSKDSKGKSLSLSDEKGNIMLMIPIEPIETDLKQIIS